MRREDKLKPKPRGVWVELTRSGYARMQPVRLTKTQAVDLLAQTVSGLRAVEGMTKQ